MRDSYPLVEAAVMAACLAVPLFAAATIAQRRGTWHAVLWAAAGLGWFLLAWQLARAGAFEGTRPSAWVVEIAAIAISLAIGSVLLGAPRRPAADAADLVAVQTVRVVAVVVLLAWAGEALPAWLALPIGLGEVVVGLAAPGVARRIRRGDREAERIARAWSAMGLLLAGFTMVAPTIASRSAGYFFSLYPLVLFPTFLAPVWLVLAAAIQRGLAVAAREPPRG